MAGPPLIDNVTSTAGRYVLTFLPLVSHTPSIGPSGPIQRHPSSVALSPNHELYPSFRQCPVQFCIGTAIVEGDVSRSFNISSSLRQISVHGLLRRCQGCGYRRGVLIRGFCHIVDLGMIGQRTCGDCSEVAPVPLHGFSPVIKSPRAAFITFPSSQISDFAF